MRDLLGRQIILWNTLVEPGARLLPEFTRQRTDFAEDENRRSGGGCPRCSPPYYGRHVDGTFGAAHLLTVRTNHPNGA